MNVNDTVIQAIRKWPTLYYCRTDVLLSYFTSTQTIEWQDGALVDTFGDPTDAETADMFLDEHNVVSEEYETGSITRQFPLSIQALIDFEARCRLKVRQRNSQVAFRRDNAELLAFITKPDKILDLIQVDIPQRNIPLLNTKMPLLNVPDNVQPDWLAAAREVIFYIFAAPNDKSSFLTTNKTFANNTLMKLHTRFGSPDGLPTCLSEWKKDCLISEH